MHTDCSSAKCAVKPDADGDGIISMGLPLAGNPPASHHPGTRGPQPAVPSGQCVGHHRSSRWPPSTPASFTAVPQMAAVPSSSLVCNATTPAPISNHHHHPPLLAHAPAATTIHTHSRPHYAASRHRHPPRATQPGTAAVPTAVQQLNGDQVTAGTRACSSGEEEQQEVAPTPVQLLIGDQATAGIRVVCPGHGDQVTAGTTAVWPGPGLLLTCCRGLEDMVALEIQQLLASSGSKATLPNEATGAEGVQQVLPSSGSKATLPAEATGAESMQQLSAATWPQAEGLKVVQHVRFGLVEVRGRKALSHIHQLASLRGVDKVAVLLGNATIQEALIAQEQFPGQTVRERLTCLAQVVTLPAMQHAWSQALATWTLIAPEPHPTPRVRFRATADKFGARYPGLDTRDFASALGEGGLAALRRIHPPNPKTGGLDSQSLASALAEGGLAAHEHMRPPTPDEVGPAALRHMQMHDSGEGLPAVPKQHSAQTVTLHSPNSYTEFVVDLKEWDMELLGFMLPTVTGTAAVSAAAAAAPLAPAAASVAPVAAARVAPAAPRPAVAQAAPAVPIGPVAPQAAGAASASAPAVAKAAAVNHATCKELSVVLGLVLPWSQLHAPSLHALNPGQRLSDPGQYLPNPGQRLRVATGRTAMRPTTAHCLARLAAIQPGELVLDPCCGVGTIPIEAAVAYPDAVYMAGDVDGEAVASARQNLEYSRQSLLLKGTSLPDIQLHEWDASSLPLEDGCVDVVISDLPWGVRELRPQLGRTTPTLRKFYPKLFRELARVLKPISGRAVLVSGARQLVRAALSDNPDLRVESSRGIVIGGLPVLLIVLRRS